MRSARLTSFARSFSASIAVLAVAFGQAAAAGCCCNGGSAASRAVGPPARSCCSAKSIDPRGSCCSPDGGNCNHPAQCECCRPNDATAVIANSSLDQSRPGDSDDAMFGVAGGLAAVAISVHPAIAFYDSTTGSPPGRRLHAVLSVWRI